ncbi:MAG: glycosyltransferase family 4 protein [bacterium]
MSTAPLKICMISDMHDAFDDRIYHKQALSMKKKGYEVTHIAVGKEHKEFISDDGIKIITIPRKVFCSHFLLNKLYKILFNKDVFKKMFKYAEKEAADIYHIHDYKVLDIGLKLKRRFKNTKIIYDVHDPLPINILERPYGKFKKLHSYYVALKEKKASKKYDYIITTEENLAEYFRNFGIRNISIIYNFTTLNTEQEYIPMHMRKYDFFYCGLISENRGIFNIIDAIEDIKKQRETVSLLIVGPIHTPGLETEIYTIIQKKNLESNIVIKPAVSYDEIGNYYKQCKIGFGIFLPLPTYHIILQIKIFEYMIYGLPIIGSNFGHIANYIKKDHAGILVNPTDSHDIGKNALELLSNNELLETYSKNGFEAAHKKYRWEYMETKLDTLYKEITHDI